MLRFVNTKIGEVLDGIPKSRFLAFWNSFALSNRFNIVEFWRGLSLIEKNSKITQYFSAELFENLASIHEAALTKAREFEGSVNEKSLKQDVNLLLDDMIEACGKSEASALIDWFEMTIDGEPARDMFVDLLSQLAVSSFQPVFLIPAPYGFKLPQSANRVGKPLNAEVAEPGLDQNVWSLSTIISS